MIEKIFIGVKVNKLYLYSNIGSEPTNLDNNPSVTFMMKMGYFISAAITTVVKPVQVTTGIYYAEVFVPITQEDGSII